MWKLLGSFIVFSYCIACFSASSEKLVDEKSWTNFLDSHAGGGAADDGESSGCQIRPKCQALRRIIVSCDADSASVGCGSCQPGFREDESRNCVVAKSQADARKDGVSAASAAAPNSSSSGGSDHGVNPVPRDAPPPAPVRPAPHDGSDFAFYVIIGTTCGLGLLIIVICAICWYKYNFASKKAEKEFINTEYDQSSGTAGDGKLALSAQMYHYQHQKQQMLAMERSNSDLQRDVSDDDSDLENDEADFTVYECPGLATTKEMEVRNPLFKEDVAEASQSPPAPGESPSSGSGIAGQK